MKDVVVVHICKQMFLETIQTTAQTIQPTKHQIAKHYYVNVNKLMQVRV